MTGNGSVLRGSIVTNRWDKTAKVDFRPPRIPSHPRKGSVSLRSLGEGFRYVKSLPLFSPVVGEKARCRLRLDFSGFDRISLSPDSDSHRSPKSTPLAVKRGKGLLPARLPSLVLNLCLRGAPDPPAALRVFSGSSGRQKRLRRVGGGSRTGRGITKVWKWTLGLSRDALASTRRSWNCEPPA